MASYCPNLDQLLKCVGCQSKLKLSSKTLACLHNVCYNCCFMEEGKMKLEKCPECHETVVNNEELNLLPFLSKYLRREQICLGKFECNLCLEDNIRSIGKFWCHQCEKVLCHHCKRVHNKFIINDHNLEEMNHFGEEFLMKETKCIFHGKEVELFCEGCETCYCDTCYKDYHGVSSSGSSCTNVHVSNVRVEVLRRKTEAPILAKEVKEFEKSVKKSSENLLKCSSELNAECGRKCVEIQRRCEGMVDNDLRELRELYEKVEQMRDWLSENENILKQIEIWLVNSHHLLIANENDVDILDGLSLLRSKVQSWNEKWNRPEKNNRFEKMDFSIDFSCFSSIGIRKEILQIKKLKTLEQLNLLRPGPDPGSIQSIHVTEKDNHIFLCDYYHNRSIIELNEFGQFVTEFRSFCDEYNRNVDFLPFDICSISSDILVVCGWGTWWWKGIVVFLERLKFYPFLKIKKFIQTKKSFYSLCEKNETIFVCDGNLEISSFTKKGDAMETITIDGLTGSRYFSWPRIRVDPSSGNFWLSTGEPTSSPSLIVSFNSEGETLSSVKKEKDFFDFCFNKFGHFFFSTQEEMFSFFPEKKLLFKFDKKSKDFPPIFVSENNIFVCVENDGKYLIKIFKIFY